MVTLEDLLQAFQTAWKNVGFLSREHEERRFEAGKEAIRKFFQREETSGFKPKMVEEKFSFILDNNRISGRWDRVDELDGHVVIVDFKSSEVHQQDAANRRTKESLQLAIYAMAYASVFGSPADSVELHFLESGLIGKTPVTDKMIMKTTERIRKASNGIRQRDYSATPSYLSCRYCAYTDICPSAIKT